MRSLRYLNTILTLIAVLLTLNLWTAWTASPSPAVDFATEARAADDRPSGVGGSAARQKAMVDELKSMNKKLDSIETTLTSGKMRVKIDSMPASRD